MNCFPFREFFKSGNSKRLDQLNPGDTRHLLRKLKAVRARNPNFTVPHLVAASGLGGKASLRTFYREVKRHELGFFNVKKKGVLSQKDRSLRLAFAKAMLKKTPSFWSKDICHNCPPSHLKPWTRTFFL